MLKLQNQAARIVTNSSFDTPSRPLIEELGWNAIEQLISNESKTMGFKSLNELAPQYLCGRFTRNSQCSTRTLCNTGTDVRLPKKNSVNAQNVFHFVEQNYRIAYQLHHNRHPFWIASNSLYRDKGRGGGFCGGEQGVLLVDGLG